MTKYEYFSIGFTRANSSLKLKRLLINLETNLLSFENENHCYLIKQSIFESHVSLHDYFMNRNFSQNFIQILERCLNNLEKKTMQSLALGNIVEILVQLFEYCQNAEQLKIMLYLKNTRVILKKWLENQSLAKTEDKHAIERISIIHAYIILTYSTAYELTPDDVLSIVTSRFMVERNYSQKQISLPKDLFLKILSVMHKKEKQIDFILNKHPDILNKLENNKIGI